jgi:hypothetical protein
MAHEAPLHKEAIVDIRKSLIAAAIVTAGIAIGASPASAGHDHYVMTPNGNCHQVASGQTGITDTTHGGYHRFHDNVHLGATESSDNPDSLGDGRAQVEVFRAGPAPAVCDGD